MKSTLVDTPGHVDFTIEVERRWCRAGRRNPVLCSVGVQSQSITVDHK
ncbi:MAG: hypothetical protein R2875_01930 [Desulfobacterales bacterium]